MANEFTSAFAFTFQKGNSKEVAESFNKSITISGTVYHHDRRSVGATEEAMSLGDCTASKAILIIHNQDDTNYVEYRSATGASNDHVYIGPGECWAFPLGTDVTAPYLIANTAACLVEYWLISRS